MTEEIHEIERLIKQSGELADSLLRLARKLREQHQRRLHEIDNEQDGPTMTLMLQYAGWLQTGLSLLKRLP